MPPPPLMRRVRATFGVVARTRTSTSVPNVNQVDRLIARGEITLVIAMQLFIRHRHRPPPPRASTQMSIGQVGLPTAMARGGRPPSARDSSLIRRQIKCAGADVARARGRETIFARPPVKWVNWFDEGASFINMQLLLRQTAGVEEGSYPKLSAMSPASH